MQKRNEQIARMARKAEHHDRCVMFQRYLKEGHVEVLCDAEPLFVRVQIEDEILKDPRDDFPTTLMMAKLALAIAAGRSHRRQRSENDHTADAMSYAFNAGPQYNYNRVWFDEAGPISIDWQKITATVKPRKQKGLRP